MDAKITPKFKEIIESEIQKHVDILRVEICIRYFDINTNETMFTVDPIILPLGSTATLGPFTININ